MKIVKNASAEVAAKKSATLRAAEDKTKEKFHVSQRNEVVKEMLSDEKFVHFKSKNAITETC